MKAIVRDSYGPPEVPELGDVAKPGAGDVQVLLRVHAAGLDPSVWHLNTGVPYVVRTMFGLRRFRSPVHGWGVPGVVEAVGQNMDIYHAPGADAEA
jgi:NADPH:quinone reductase-like Zn-dependent oxidoreductase